MHVINVFQGPFVARTLFVVGVCTSMTVRISRDTQAQPHLTTKLAEMWSNPRAVSRLTISVDYRP